MLQKKGRNLRRRFGLPLLRPRDANSEESFEVYYRHYIYESQVSYLAYGSADDDWTGYFLLDEFYQRDSRVLDSESEEDGGILLPAPADTTAGAALGNFAARGKLTDPIIGKARDEASQDPRCYTLEALSQHLILITKQEEGIADQFNHSIREYKDVRNAQHLILPPRPPF
jgi:hypothetical protein